MGMNFNGEQVLTLKVKDAKNNSFEYVLANWDNYFQLKLHEGNGEKMFTPVVNSELGEMLLSRLERAQRFDVASDSRYSLEEHYFNLRGVRCLIDEQALKNNILLMRYYFMVPGETKLTAIFRKIEIRQDLANVNLLVQHEVESVDKRYFKKQSLKIDLSGLFGNDYSNIQKDFKNLKQLPYLSSQLGVLERKNWDCSLWTGQ